MPYPIKDHTIPLLDKILGTAGLAGQVEAFIAELDKWNAKHPDGKTNGKKHENLHDYLVSAKANHSLYNFIYATLGTSNCAHYADTAVAPDVVDEYIAAFQEAGKWSAIGFQSQPSGYLICHSDTPADERMILNFKEQSAALNFTNILRNKVSADVSFKVLLSYKGTVPNVSKNDKIVIYYPKVERANLLALVDVIPESGLSAPISGFYLKVKDGVGIAAETEPSWSFTMYTAEYCMKYLVNHSPAGKEKDTPATAEGMYAYVVRRLLKNGRIPDSLADPADLPAAE